MIKPLPKWVLTNNYPAFYDTESVTAIEMVAKLYGSMEELITDYNNFIDLTNQHIADFESGLINDFNDFKELIEGEVDDFIETVNGKIAEQDGKIDNAIDYMKTNLLSTVTTLFNEYLNNGDILVSLGERYDSDTEALTLYVEAIPSEEVSNILNTLVTVGEEE